MGEDRPLQAGSVELKSGAWSWSARSVAGGTTVVFHHRQRARDEMRAWVATPIRTQEDVLALAREPVTRVWTDSIGLSWSLSVERMSGTERRRLAGESAEADPRWLVFQRGGVRRHAVLEPGTFLGELSRAELQELFDSV